jgi:regulator of protease activity HflC (stomatin/prohibitin superfamily)
MTLILFLIIFGIFAFILGLYKKSTYVITAQEPLRGGGFTATQKPNPFGLIKLLGAVVISLLISSFQPIHVERIEVGNVGIRVDNAGGSKGVSRTEYVTGWAFYNGWISSIHEFSIRQKHLDYPEIQIVTKGGFQTVIKPTFNYSLNAGSVGDMFQNLGKDILYIEENWLKTAIVGAVTDVANLYSVDSIFNHRSEFEHAIATEANKRVARWFNLSQLRTNIVPPEPLRKSIEAKTQAIQDVQVAENQKKVAEAEAATAVARAVGEANAKIAQARGDSTVLVVNAAAKAEAIRKEQLNLTPLYVDYLRSQKWNGAYPTTMLGSGTGALLNIK